MHKGNGDRERSKEKFISREVIIDHRQKLKHAIPIREKNKILK